MCSDFAFEQLDQILSIIRDNIVRYYIIIGSQGGSIKWGYGIDDEAFTMKFSNTIKSMNFLYHRIY